MGSINPMFDVGTHSKSEFIHIGSRYLCNYICIDLGGCICGDSECTTVGWQDVS